MSIGSALLAREMVRFDTAIMAAAKLHLWEDAADLERERENIAAARWAMLRREWAERLQEVA